MRQQIATHGGIKRATGTWDWPFPDQINLSSLKKLNCIPELARNNSLFMKQKYVLGKPSWCEIKSSHCLHMKK